jgi:hypothetical protein
MTRKYTKQNHTNLLGLAKLLKFGLKHFALTSCGLLQNPKSEIRNRQMRASAEKIKAPTRYSGGSDHENAVRWRRTTIYEPTGNAAAAALCRQFAQAVLPATDRNPGTISNCGATSHFSYLPSHISHLTSDIVRRQLFDDIMKARPGVMGIFSVWRGFLETTWFSRQCVVFQVGCAVPGVTHPSNIDLVCRGLSSRRRCSSLKRKAEHALSGRGMLWFENGGDRSSFSVLLKADTVTVIGEDSRMC